MRALEHELDPLPEERPSPQQQAEIDAASEPRDCIKCERCYDVREGVSVRCTSRDEMGDPDPVLWRFVTGMPCHTFRPIGASPPVSADREGAERMTDETLEHLDYTAFGALKREARRARSSEAALADDLRRESDKNAVLVDRNTTMHTEILHALAFLDRPDVSAALHGLGLVPTRQNLRDALSPAEARRERPDPRDATIRDLRALLGRCATALAGFVEGHSVHGSGCLCPKCIEGRATLAALRSAGVEPTPASPDPAFDGMPCAICGEPLPHEKCGPTPEAPRTQGAERMRAAGAALESFATAAGRMISEAEREDESLKEPTCKP